jgi:hypothetical protein
MKGNEMIIIAKLFLLVTLITSICFSQVYIPEKSNRIKINFGETPWKFIKSDPSGAQNLGYNDASWATVGIPHTWNDTNTFLNMSGGGSAGALLGVTGWYRKHFTLDNSFSDRKIFIEFEGAHIGAQVYINGTFISGNSSVNPQATHVIGFVPFIVDITPYVKFGGEDNVLAVRVSTGASWFTYPDFSVDFRFGQGSGGIFRPVWMHITDKVYIPENVYSVLNTWGTYVVTNDANSSIADVTILTNVKNELNTDQNVILTTKIVDPNGIVVATNENTANIKKDNSYVFEQNCKITSPKLWYPNMSLPLQGNPPPMYKVYHIVKVGNNVVDVVTSPLGIRTITWDKDFPYINGIPHYLWGAAGRYDYPALGTAVCEEQQWRDAKLLADCGGRLWRPGHSPCSRAFVEACDAYGIMLIQPSGENEGTFMTENIGAKTPYNRTLKAECHRDIIVRDRNHPSILAWEISNAPINAEFATALKDTTRKYDFINTRAISDRGNNYSGPNGADAPIADLLACSLDGCEVGLKGMRPDKPCWGAEGFYTKGTRFDYDNELNFAKIYVQNWKSSKRAKAFGMTHWYLAESPGEEGIGRNFACSMMDFNRIPKMLYYIYKACWTPYQIKPVVHLSHHWNRSGNIQVSAFSNCPTVRLLINGNNQGTRTPYPDTGTGNALLPLQCTWDVTWQSGTVRAEGLDSKGNVVCFDEKKTAGQPAKILLSVEPPIIKPNGDTFKIFANGSDAAFILATIVDQQGNWCPTASNIVRFSVSGPTNYRGGSDQMVGQGGANYHAPGDPELSAEGGMCKVAVRSTFTPGIVTVTATSPGLSEGTTSFTVYPVNQPVNIIPSKYFALINKENLKLITSTTGKIIKYFINVSSNISIDVFNSAGRILYNKNLSKIHSGWHSIVLNDNKENNFSKNGIYLIRFTFEKQKSITYKVVLLK